MELSSSMKVWNTKVQIVHFRQLENGRRWTQRILRRTCKKKHAIVVVMLNPQGLASDPMSMCASEKSSRGCSPCGVPSLVVHAIANGLNHARLGISVPRKITRRAVVRNRLKRLVREAFRLNKAALPRGVDLIVVPRQSKLSATTISSSLRVLAPDAARRAGVATVRNPPPVGEPSP